MCPGVSSVATRILFGRVVTLTGGFGGNVEAWRGRENVRIDCLKEVFMSGTS